MDNPDLTVDWTQVPLLRTHSAEHVNALHRCSAANPELAKLRDQALHAVTQAFDRIFLPAGYTRTRNTWHRGPGARDIADLQTARQRAAQHDPGGLVTSFGQFWRRLRRNVPLGRTDGTVYLSMQKSTSHTGFFINAGVRNVHVPMSDLTGDPVWVSSATPDGQFRSFRLSRFLPELPPTHRPDEFAYVRLVEDPRLLDFLLHVVEKRIAPWLALYAQPGAVPRPPPSPAAMAQRAGALPYGAGD